MAVVTQQHYLNIIPGIAVPNVIHCSQGDTGVNLTFTLMEGSELFDTTGATISAHGKRQDNVGWGPVTCTKSGSDISFTLPAAATAIAGSGIAEVTVAKSGQTVGTTNFAILVENATFPLGYTYDNDVSVYQAILDFAQSNLSTLQSQISSEAASRIATDALLQSQIDEIIAPSGEAPSAAEIQDARIGADNVTYSTLGNAIRTQIEGGNLGIERIIEGFSSTLNMPIQWCHNAWDYQSGSIITGGQWARSAYKFKPNKKYAFFTLPSTLEIYLIDFTAQSSITIRYNSNNYQTLNPSHEYGLNGRYSDYHSPITDAELQAFQNVKMELSTTILECVEEAVNSSNYSTLLSNANNAEYNSLYRIEYGTTDTFTIQNLPTMEAGIMLLITLRELSSSYGVGVQYLITANNAYYRRKEVNWGTWRDMKKLNLRQFPTLILSSNYTTYLSDLNDALINVFYVGFMNPNTMPANAPVVPNSYSVFTTYLLGDGTHRQQLFNIDGVTYQRNYVNGVWAGWTSEIDILPKTFTAEESDNVCDVIAEALKYRNSTVIINGTHDLLAEYMAKYTDWATRNESRGMVLNNNITVKGNSNTKLTFNYTGSDNNVKAYMSMFDIRAGGATIENLQLEAKNVKYCVHADNWTLSSPYEVVIKKSTMKIDNSQNSQRSDNPICIGAGFGMKGTATVEDCILSAIGGDGTTYPAPAHIYPIYWHNGPNNSQQSRLLIKNNYLSGGILIESNGNATEETPVTISNNSLGDNLDEGYVSGYNTHNMVVYAFNNEMR